MASDVKWIKLTTDMFDDEKIDFITSLPEADAIIVIWIRLLSLAGKCNAGGYIYLTERIPYTEDMLSHKFRKPITIIKLALGTFQRLGMVEYDENIILISNWNKHQNVEGMDKIREQTRTRTAIYREKLKQLPTSDVKCDVTVTQGDAIELEQELELDKEIELKPSLSKNKFSDESIEFLLASELYNLILDNNPKFKTPNLQSWAKSIDLMIRADKRNATEIREVIRWCQKDNFWQGNILSTNKLREKYDQLTMKMSTKQTGPQNYSKKPKTDNKYEAFYL